MTAPAVAPGDLTDAVDVDAIAAAVRRCPGVEDLYAGSPAELATYLPGRRVVGVRVAESAVSVQIQVRWGRPIPEIASAVLAAVAPLAGGRQVDVLVADLVGEPTESTSEPGREERELSRQPSEPSRQEQGKREPSGGRKGRGTR